MSKMRAHRLTLLLRGVLCIVLLGTATLKVAFPLVSHAPSDGIDALLSSRPAYYAVSFIEALLCGLLLSRWWRESVPYVFAFGLVLSMATVFSVASGPSGSACGCLGSLAVPSGVRVSIVALILIASAALMRGNSGSGITCALNSQ